MHRNKECSVDISRNSSLDNAETVQLTLIALELLASVLNNDNRYFLSWAFQASTQALLLSQLQLSESQFKVNDLFKVTDEPYSGFCSTFNIFSAHCQWWTRHHTSLDSVKHLSWPFNLTKACTALKLKAHSTTLLFISEIVYHHTRRNTTQYNISLLCVENRLSQI